MDIQQIIFRLLLGALIGGLIGAERERTNNPAGFRTHILVTVGATLIMLISKYGFEDVVRQPDPARISAQVVSGIGFLGAGTIYKERNWVKGLTTAAGLWVCSGLGLAVGAGMYGAALTATAIVVLSLTVLNRWEKEIILRESQKDWFIVNIDCVEPGTVIEELERRLGTDYIEMTDIKVEKEDSPDEAIPRVRIRVRLQTDGAVSLTSVMQAIEQVEGVQSFSCKRIYHKH